METFIIVKDLELGCQVEQLIAIQAKLTSLWMVVLDMVIDREGFVE